MRKLKLSSITAQWKEAQNQIVLMQNSHQNFQEELIQILRNVFHMIETEESLPNCFYQARYSDQKNTQRLNQERELQTNLTHEYWCIILDKLLMNQIQEHIKKLPIMIK